MPAPDTADLTLETNLERVFAHIQSPDWLERVGSLYMVNLRTQKPEVQQIYALYSEARELEANQPQQGLRLCELARERSLEINYAPGLAWYWRETGSIQQTLGEMPNAEKALQNAIQAFTKLGIRVGIASSLNILGHVLAVNGRLEESICNYREYVRVARELGRPESEAIGLANIAETHLDLGQPWRALEVLLESQRVLQELHFNPSASSWVLGLIGRAYHDLGDDERALTCLFQTLELNRFSQDQHGEVGTLAMMAKIHRINGDLETANETLNEALRLNESHGDQSQRTHLLTAHAALQRLQRNPTRAKQSAPQALEIALENNNRIGELNARIEFSAHLTGLRR